MRPTKRIAVKRPRKKAVKKAYDGKSPMGKLQKLKYRINDAAKEENGFSVDMGSDKAWVIEEITNLKQGGWLSATKMKVANEMWDKYGG